MKYQYFLDEKVYSLLISPEYQGILIVSLSLLIMTSLNQMREMLPFVCVKWLMRPILALNSLLQIKQERSEEESSASDALSLAFR